MKQAIPSNRMYHVLFLLICLCASSVFTLPVMGQEPASTERKTKRVPTLRSTVYSQLSRAQSKADEGSVEDALAVLDEVKRKASSMNSYELAMMHNFYGFIQYNAEQVDEAIASFEQVIQQSPIPESFEKTTIFSLAQLHMAQGNYEQTVAKLERWEALNKDEVPAKNWLLKAQAMYQNKDYDQALTFINNAIDIVENDEFHGGVADENWYILQRAIYFELKQTDQVKDVIAKLIKHYNQGKYWIQLAGMYGELGEEKKQLAVMETAYIQGEVSTASDVFSLAQLYYFHQIPYKGALLMEQALESGVLEPNLRNLRFLSQCWSLAKETEKAIPVMRSAAELSDDGELDIQLANILFNGQDYAGAAASAKQALEKGRLRNEGNAHVILGLAYYNLGKFPQALDALAQAEAFKKSSRMAKQWRKYVASEKVSYERKQAELEASKI